MDQQPTTQYKRHRLALSAIDVGERVREEYGDLPYLMESVQKHGLIQPIVVTPQLKLIAGGRRYYSHVALVELGHETFNEIDVVFKDALDEDDLVEMELEENNNREDMTWQEKALGVLKIHRIKVRKAAKMGEQWTQRMTALSINRIRQRVTQILPVARALDDALKTPLGKQSPIWLCKDLIEATALMLEEQQKQAEARLAAMSVSPSGLVLSKGLVVSAGTGQPIDSKVDVSKWLKGMTSSPTIGATPSGIVTVESGPVTSPDAPAEKRSVSINLAEYFTVGHCIPWMLAHKGEFDHIITDPPYAVDMDMLQQDGTGMNIDATRAAHQIEENKELLPDFVQCAYETLKDASFLVMFCDFQHFQWLHDLGVKNGFSVQRWPVIWCKPAGMNQAAGFNFTKAAECAILMRKGNATLQVHQPLNWRCISKDQQDKDFHHPFAKPLALWNWMLEACTRQGQVVLDAFSGSGSGVAASIKAGRQWRACEKEQNWAMEFLRNISKCYTEAFDAQKIETHIHYTLTQSTEPQQTETT